MSAKRFRDNISKNYLSDPRRFAQVCNNTLFSGQHIISAEGLSELDAYERKITGLKPGEMESEGSGIYQWICENRSSDSGIYDSDLFWRRAVGWSENAA